MSNKELRDLPPIKQGSGISRNISRVCQKVGILRFCTNPDNPPGVQTPGSQIKSSKDDWIRVLFQI